MGNIIDLQNDLFHMAKIALSGRPQDTQIFVRKLARKYQSHDEALSRELIELLRQTPTRSSLTRKVEPAGMPVDQDTRLPLMRVLDPPVLEVEPIYNESVWQMIQQVIKEQQALDRLADAGLDPTRSALFTGLPGVGKTYAAKWIARELKRPLITLDLSAVMSSYLGRTGNNVRAVLDYAKGRDCVLLLDELDAVAKRRDDSTEVGELKRLVTVLLQEIDEWPSTGLLIAATNHAELLDPAVWRRFETIIEFQPPDQDSLIQVCQDLLDQESSVYWPKVLALIFAGSSFSDISQQVKRARRLASVNEEDTDHALMQMIQHHMNSLDGKQRIQVAMTLVKHTKLSQREIQRITGVSRDTIRKHKATGSR